MDEAFKDTKPKSKGCLKSSNIVEIMTLDMWGGVPSMKMYPFMELPCRVYFMNTSSQECHDPARCKSTIQWLQNYKMVMEAKPDLRYNFIIGGDGYVYEARGWSSQPLLPVQYRGYGIKSILIGFIGKFTDKEIPPGMHKTAFDFIENSKRNGYLAERVILQYILQRPSIKSSGVYRTSDPN